MQLKEPSPCLPAPDSFLGDLHLPVSSCCIVWQTQSSTDFGRDAIFYNYCKQQLNNGNEILFPPSFAFKCRWHHPCGCAANERGRGPGGLQPTLRSPARPDPGGGNTWPTSTTLLLGHPPTRFCFHWLIYFNTCLSAAPALCSTGLWVFYKLSV